MTDNIKNDIKNNISNLYKKHDTLYGKYGHDVWMSICIIIILVLAITYTYIINHLQSLKGHWVKERCNPLFMPFAAYINNIKNSRLEYVLSNFVYCITNITKQSTEKALDPIYYLVGEHTKIMHTNIDVTGKLRDQYSAMRDRYTNIYQYMINVVNNITTPFYIIVIKIQDTFRKIVATLTVAMFTLVSVFRLMKLFIINIANIIMLEIFAPLLAIFLVLLAIWAATYWLGPLGPGFYIMPILIVMAPILLIVYIILSKIVGEINHLFDDMGLTQPNPPPGI